MADPKMDRLRITFVDGFCGGGTYQDDEQTTEGSPLILLRAIEQARNAVNKHRIKPVEIDARFHFVDKSQSSISHLEEVLRERGFGPQIGSRIVLRAEKFEEAYPEIKQEIDARTRRGVGRSIFILDQKGYSDVPFPILRDILSSFSASEVVLTFAVDWLIDYLTNSPEMLKALSSVEISPVFLKELLEAKNESGGRYVIQRRLRDHLQRCTQAKYMSPFFIRSQSANKSLWLVHLSNHKTARNVMVDGHWGIGNCSIHPGRGGLEIRGFDPGINPDQISMFQFEDQDQQQMSDLLQDDILRRLPSPEMRSPVLFDSFLDDVVNETPARLSDLGEAVESLVARGDLLLVNQNNSLRRTHKPSLSDRLLRNPQGRLSL